MKPREYCCCAIPIVNAGIYFTLVEQLVLAVVAGTLAISTPQIVGAATPSFAPWIFAAVCYVAAGIQVFGFIGVAKEKSILYRRYVTMHLMATLLAFAVALTWIIISASRHSTAESKCLTDFFKDVPSDSPTKSEGSTLCNIFSWVDIGLMGGLFVVFALAQTYFYVVVSSYGSGQRRDHEKYDANDPTRPLADDIPLSNRDPWDSGDDGRGDYGHIRNGSDATVTGANAWDNKGGYTGSPSYPHNAYTHEPSPTPTYNNDSYYSGRDPQISRPSTSQAHPAIGSFRRKTPRLHKENRENMDFDRRFFTGNRF